VKEAVRSLKAFLEKPVGWPEELEIDI